MASENNNNHQLHILLFPLMAQGHILPISDIARLFASRNVKTTIITTPANISRFSKITRNNLINLKIINFPSKEVGLHEGLENLGLVSDKNTHNKFFEALSLLQEPFEEILQQLRPDALVSDFFFPWTTDLAFKFGIPRLIFLGTGFFPMCCVANIEEHEPHLNLSSDTELFTLPGFPDPVKFTRFQLPDFMNSEKPNIMGDLLLKAKEAERRSFGILVNSFYELERDYVDYYKNVLRRKAWHIGPVSLSSMNLEEEGQKKSRISMNLEEEGQRGELSKRVMTHFDTPDMNRKEEGQSSRESRNNEHECIKWLDSKESNSVLYVCFGTITKFSESQLHEIALGLEASEQDFILVVKKQNNQEKWLPNGYEKRMKQKGLIIRGWAPQVMILDHQAIGGFVTHCGWNSVLEGVSAGLPMVTWPICGEQFFNEKLITDVLKIGVGVGAKKWVTLVGDYVESKKIEKAVKEIMVGEKAEEFRKRANKFGEMARKAIQFGESSYNDLNSLIQELKSYHT